MNNLLKWSIENSNASTENGPPPTDRPINAEALAQLMGGPSDADMMRESMAAILSTEVDLENKMVAFDNLEQLIENIDNANNMENLGLWPPLLELLKAEEADLRRMAAWCVGTATQNNVKAQDRLLALDGVSKVVHVATTDSNAAVRRKTVYALSSAVRNYQPGMDAALETLPKEYLTSEKVDAGDMEAIDAIMDKLRAAA